jgi:hypothetical protein
LKPDASQQNPNATFNRWKPKILNGCDEDEKEHSGKERKEERDEIHTSTRNLKLEISSLMSLTPADQLD